MRSSVCVSVLLVLVVCAIPATASCFNCYGNFCGDRLTCCGSDGQMQITATADTPACDDLDQLCKAHDLCTAEFTDDDTTGGACTCDAIFKAGIEKAKTNSSFYMNEACQISGMAPGECQLDCFPPDLKSSFTLETADQFVGLKNSCSCATGPTAGAMVTDIATHCPAENKCVEYVKRHNCEGHYMHRGWFVRRLRHLRFWWWSWLWTSQRPQPPPECNGISPVPQPAPNQCDGILINTLIWNVPDACKCDYRDLRCLMKRGIWNGVCKSHVTLMVSCITLHPTVVAYRSLLASSDFNSVEPMDSSSAESTQERIGMVYWLPVTCVLAVALITSLTYMRVRTNQYKRRIEQLNNVVSSRSTGLSVINGEEVNLNPVATDSAEVEVTAE